MATRLQASHIPLPTAPPVASIPGSIRGVNSRLMPRPTRLRHQAARRSPTANPRMRRTVHRNTPGNHQTTALPHRRLPRTASLNTVSRSTAARQRPTRRSIPHNSILPAGTPPTLRNRNTPAAAATNSRLTSRRTEATHSTTRRAALRKGRAARYRSLPPSWTRLRRARAKVRESGRAAMARRVLCEAAVGGGVVEEGA
jgi:hypothetical protein